MSLARISKQINIMVNEDRPGLLARLTGAIYEMGVNIEAICAYGQEGASYFMLVTSDNQSAVEALSANGLKCEEEEVILLDLPDKPGVLDDIAKKMAEKGVNLQFIYASAAGSSSLVVIKADDNSQALAVIG